MAPTSSAARAGGHGSISRALVVAGALIAVLAILAIWVSRQALETDQWTRTSSQLLDDPAIQKTLAAYLVDQLYANVDVAGELRSALPPRARPLAGPAAGALRRGADEVAQRSLSDPRIQAVWDDANRRAHRLLVKVVQGDGSVVSADQGVVTLDLTAMVDQIAQQTGIGARVAARLPAGAARIQILRSNQLRGVQTAGRLLKPAAAALVLAMLACFGAAIALAAGRRRETLRACGVALVFAGVAALVARKLGGGVVVDRLATTSAVRPAVESTWSIGTSLLVGVAVATIAYGALTIAGTWLAGPMPAAVSVRRWLAPYLRDPLITYGVAGAVVLLVLLWGPTEATRRILPALVLVALLAAGLEALRRQVRGEFPDARRHNGRPSGGHAGRLAGRALAAFPSRAGGGGDPIPAPAEDGSVAQLERLDELHRAGGLDDEEFATAKRRVLAGV